jgi:hypothetical protein
MIDSSLVKFGSIWKPELRLMLITLCSFFICVPILFVVAATRTSLRDVGPERLLRGGQVPHTEKTALVSDLQSHR